jgi:hypothetical protein
MLEERSPGSAETLMQPSGHVWSEHQQVYCAFRIEAFSFRDRPCQKLAAAREQRRFSFSAIHRQRCIDALL